MQYLNGISGQLIILIAVVGFSVLGHIVRKLREQAVIRQQQQLRERMQVEALRTGRAPAEPSAEPKQSPEQRLAELAARRAELVRQGRAPVQTRANAPRPPQTPQRQGQPGVPRPVTRAPAPRPAPGPRPVTQQRGPQSPQRPVQRPVQQPGPRPVPRAPMPNQPPTTAQRRQEMIDARRRALEARARSQPQQAPEPTPKPRKAASPAVPQAKPIAEFDPFAAGKSKLKMSRAKLREAIVLREILDVPIALRQEDAF